MPNKLKKQGKQMTVRESDRCKVPQTSANAERTKPGNAGEGKAATPSRSSDHASTGRSDGPSVLTRLDYITERAQKQPEEVFNNLYHLLNYELLWLAFRRLKQGKAPGVDGVTVEEYGANLQGNLQDLAITLGHNQTIPRTLAL